jgi:hypothetical protein
MPSMPSLTVSLDGAVLATVCCDGYDVVSVRVGGTRVEEEFAAVGMTAGCYPDEGESTSLTWVNELELLPGQTVAVSLLKDGVTSHPGKTIDELFPDEEPTEVVDFKITQEMLQELRAKPPRRVGWGFQLNSSSGTSYSGRTAPAEHGFGFSVLWNMHRPERASVSLHSYTIDSLEHRTPMHDHVREHLQLGQSVAIKVDA